MHTVPYAATIHMIHPPRDTPGHILGSCQHPRIAKCIIARHNQAVCLLQRCIHNTLGPLSGHYTIMDATSSSALPHGVFATRVPKWMFAPDFDDTTRLLLRPDILIIEGLPSDKYLALRDDIESQSPFGTAFITSLKQSPTTKVHIIELGYTSDATYDRALSRKLTQHNRLASHLLSAGWTLASSPNPPALSLAHADDPPTLDPLPPQLPHNIPDLSRHVHIFLLSTSGVIYKPADTICSLLGIPTSDISDLYARHMSSLYDSLTRSSRHAGASNTIQPLSHPSHTSPSHLIRLNSSPFIVVLCKHRAP